MIPDELTDDMTPADLVDVLARLPFGRGSSPAATCQLTIDRGARDYLVRTLKVGRHV